MRASGRQEKSRSLTAPAAQLVCARMKLNCGKLDAHGRDARASKPCLSKQLCATPRPNGQVAHLGKNARHLHTVQLRHKRQHIRNELVFQQLPNLLLPAALPTREKTRDADLKGACETFEGRECRGRLFVLDLRDVGTRHRHAERQLTLAHAIAQSERANGLCQVQVTTTVRVNVDRRSLGLR